jgi:hypothetical protein
LKISVMTNAWNLRRLATVTVVAIAVGGCASSGGKAPAADRSVTPSSTTPTTNTAPPSQSDVAATAASALVAKYYATVDKLGKQPTASLADLSTVAIGVQLSAERTFLTSQRKAKETQTGDTTIVKLDIQSVNLDDSDPSAGKVPTVQIDACWDVSRVDVVDASGKSIVSSSRPNTGWTRLTVANYHYAIDPRGGWRVVTGADLKKDPCAAS